MYWNREEGGFSDIIRITINDVYRGEAGCDVYEIYPPDSNNQTRYAINQITFILFCQGHIGNDSSLSGALPEPKTK